MISIDPRDATSQGATLIEAKLNFSLVGGPWGCDGAVFLVPFWTVWGFVLILEIVETGNTGAVTAT